MSAATVEKMLRSLEAACFRVGAELRVTPRSVLVEARFGSFQLDASYAYRVIEGWTLRSSLDLVAGANCIPFTDQRDWELLRDDFNAACAFMLDLHASVQDASAFFAGCWPSEAMAALRGADAGRRPTAPNLAPVGVWSEGEAS